MAERYKVGTKVWFEGTFTSKDTGQPTDPTEVTVEAWYEGDAPADVQTFTLSGGTVTRTAPGVYTVGVVSTKAKHLYAEFDGTGDVEVTGVEYAIIEDTGRPT